MQMSTHAADELDLKEGDVHVNRWWASLPARDMVTRAKIGCELLGNPLGEQPACEE